MGLDALKPSGAAQAHPSQREMGLCEAPSWDEPEPQSHRQPGKPTLKIPRGWICYNRPGDQRDQNPTASRKAAAHPCSSNTRDGILPSQGWSAQLPHHPRLHYSPLPSLFPLLYKRRDVFKNIPAYF